MQYKFYIYKQANLLPSFNKYDILEYSLIREITQNSKWGLKIERDKEFFTVIRTKFNGSITVKGTDFDALIALEETHIQYAVIIQQLCGGVWVEKWKGFFSYFDFKVDLDTCYLTFEPSVWDLYTPIFDQFEIERNVLSADSDWIMRMQAYEWPTESIGTDYTYVGFAILVGFWHEYTGLPAGNDYYLYSAETTFLEWVPDPGSPGSFIGKYSVHETYKRDIGYSNSNTVDPSGGGGGGVADWTWVEEVSPGLHKWSRPLLNSVYTVPYTVTNSGMNFTETLVTPALQTVFLYGLKRLSKVIDYFATFFDLTYASHFFLDSPCPMGGTSLAWTMLQQISNLRATGEQASKGMMKLKDALTWIRDTFNVYPFIDSLGDFRLEHRKYFDYGLSYSYTHVIELDLATLYPDNIRHLNRYEWSKPSLVRFETLEIPYSGFFDWMDAKIEYPQLSILGNETKNVTVGWGTDIIAMTENKTDLPKIGWVLLNVNVISGLYWVINTTGAISGNSMQNARFSQGNLFRDLWTYGRLLPSGNVNGVPTTFDSIERLKKQVELSFPQCCTVIDYNGLFRTDLGDGLIDSAEYESETGNLKVQLIYE
jgi:hypothetical protein